MPKKITRPGLRLSGSTGVARDRCAVIKQLVTLKDAFFPNFALVFAYVLILNREGTFVPSKNEVLYLLQPAKLWDSNFLASDWTFSGSLTTHFIFDLLVGPLTLVFPLELVGWLGRILCWSLTLVALLKFGQYFRIPQWLITVSILFLLFPGQSVVGGEWISEL